MMDGLQVMRSEAGSVLLAEHAHVRTGPEVDWAGRRPVPYSARVADSTSRR
jgi:hypothetical protein